MDTVLIKCMLVLVDEPAAILFKKGFHLSRKKETIINDFLKAQSISS